VAFWVNIVILSVGAPLVFLQSCPGEYPAGLSEASPYPGAKPSFLIEDQIDDREWLSKLIELTEQELSKSIPVSGNNNGLFM